MGEGYNYKCIIDLMNIILTKVNSKCLIRVLQLITVESELSCVTMIAWEKQKQTKLEKILEKYSKDIPAKPPAYRNTPSTPQGHATREYGCGDIMDDFCANSTIHGIKYVGDRKRHLAEKLWWLIAFLLSIYGCSRLIFNVWQRWDRSPVIVSFEEKATPIWQIPFPAVTICMETKSQSDLFNYTAMYHRIKAIDDGWSKNNFTEEE